MLHKLLLQEIQLLPEFAQMEVLNFLVFTKNKHLQASVFQEHEKRPFLVVVM